MNRHEALSLDEDQERGNYVGSYYSYSYNLVYDHCLFIVLISFNYCIFFFLYNNIIFFTFIVLRLHLSYAMSKMNIYFIYNGLISLRIKLLFIYFSYYTFAFLILILLFSVSQYIFEDFYYI